MAGIFSRLEGLLVGCPGLRLFVLVGGWVSEWLVSRSWVAGLVFVE